MQEQGPSDQAGSGECITCAASERRVQEILARASQVGSQSLFLLLTGQMEMLQAERIALLEQQLASVKADSTIPTWMWAPSEWNGWLGHHSDGGGSASDTKHS